MKKYEITFIVSENYTEDRAADIAKDVKKAIEARGGKVEKEVFWGKRKLIYKIAKNSFGYYYVFIFDLDPTKAEKLNKDLNLNEKLIRFLMVDFIENSPFFEEGAEKDGVRRTGKSKKDEEEEQKEETREERRSARRFTKREEVIEAPVEEVKEKEEKVEESDEVAQKKVEKAIEKEVAGSEGLVASEEKKDTKETEEVPAIEDRPTGDQPKVGKTEGVPIEEAKEEPKEERKTAKKMTEDERKEQLEKKLAELLKDEEL